jgi:hypothetical protein
MKSILKYTTAEISNDKPPFNIVSNWLIDTPGNILRLNRKNPILHNENRIIISRILYIRTTKIFLENTQFFILLFVMH